MSAFKKNMLSHPDFYMVEFEKNSAMPYLLFIHGGPGLNCGTMEYLVEHNNLFDQLNCNIIFYDQRNCGRSKRYSGEVLHRDNVNDLHKIISYFKDEMGVKIGGLIGHSYGAKILYDYCTKFHFDIPAIFLSTATSILIPRLNNLILDLSYLKKAHPQKYEEVLLDMQDFDLKKMRVITEKLNPLFNENKERPYLYWANLACFELVQKIQQQINLPINNEVFVSVRNDLYSDEKNYSVDISSIKQPVLWVNGLHDYIINGAAGLLSGLPTLTTFYGSSHYPHIEESNKFSRLVNGFIRNI